MKKVNFIHLRSKLPLLLLVFLLTFSTTSFSQEDPAEEVTTKDAGDVAAGESLFKANCAACHKMDKKAVGPALRGVGEKFDREWLHKWIKNSQELIASGDATAVRLFEENNKMIMPPFPGLSDKDLDNILAYTDQPKAAPSASTSDVAGAGAATSGDGAGVSNGLVIGVLALVFLFLVIVLYLVTNTLKRIAKAKGVVNEEEVKVKRLSIWKAFIQNQFLVLVFSFLLILVGSYFAYGYLMQVGVDQGYAPVQPIHYSHKIHAGDNQIDCNFCHSSARNSKIAGIPSLNVCMSCHKNISEVTEDTATEEYSKEFYDGEIAKLYNAVGWNPEEQEYTGKTEPVKWVRIHNLPDFTYFNHSQHVTVAGVACQTCHGEVESMEIMEQFAPLTMGWCISCHKETNVNLANNEYYAKIHEELSKKYGVEKLTIAELGGLECGKCHY